MMKTDTELQRDVLTELAWEPGVDHANIGVAVNDGVVTLSGYVASYPEKARAEQAAKRIAGVRAIAEEIEVRFDFEPKVADHEIAKRIADLFEWNVFVPHESIAIKVQHGWVTLTGSVEWQFQAREARKAAGRISGVVGITNAIQVGKLPTASDVHQRIAAALKRQAQLEGAQINVVVDGSTVRLGGRVRAWSERGIAERAAWAAPGVTAIEDNILVAA
jgi:osmotically-inducible protein OsmY